MLGASKSVGEIIVLASLEKEILTRKSLRQSVEDLLDLIKTRVKNKPIEEVAQSLLDNMFRVRHEVLQWFSAKDLNLNDYFGVLNEQIASNLRMAHFSDLSKSLSNVLLAYENILSPIVTRFSPDIQESFSDIKDFNVEYDMIKLLSLHPSPRISYVKKWVDASLSFEVGIILADLVLTNQVKLSKKRIKGELVDFLWDGIVRFGAYSIFTRFWTPPDDDLGNLTNSMKILAAKFEMDNGIYHTVTKEELFEMFKV